MIIQLLFYFLFPFLFSVFSPLFPSELEVTTELITSGKQKLAFTEDGRSILVWSYNNDSTQSSDIMAQIYTSSGAIDIPQFKVNGNLAFSRQNPCIAVQSDGSFVVVWESFGQDGNMTDIYCQIFDGKANKVGSEFQINVITDGNQTSPCVSVMNDYFVVAWVGPDDSMNGIYANFFDLQGNKVEKSEFLVNENNTFLDQNSPSVVMIFESSNSSVFLGFAITWTVYEEDGTSLGVFINFFYYFFEYRMHFSTGEAKASYYNETQQQNPQIAMALTQANFIFFPYFIADVVIVWQCSEISEDIGDMLGIYAYKFQIRVYMIESGVFALELLSWMPEFKVNSYTYNSQVEPVVGFTQNNNFIVVWQSFYQDSDGWGIFMQEFTEDGAKYGPEQQVNVYYKGNQNNASISLATNGDFAIAWVSASLTNQGISLNFQIFQANTTNFEIQIQGNEVHVDQDINSTYLRKMDLDLFSALGYYVVVWCEEATVNGTFFNSQNENIFTVSINMANVTGARVSYNLPEAGYAIVWENYYSHQIYIAYFIYDYQMTDIIQVNSVTNGTNPDIDCFDSGYCLVLWNSVNSGNNNIYAQFFNNSYKPIYPIEFQVNSFNETNQHDPSLYISDEGSVIIVWLSDIILPNNQKALNILARWFILNETVLNPFKPEFSVYNTSSYFDLKPSVATSDSGLFIVVWHDLGADGSGYGIIGQIYSNYWSRMGQTNFLINTYTYRDQRDPVVNINPSGFFVSWSSFLQDSDEYGIFGQFFDLQGNKINEEIQINMDFYGDQRYPQVVLDDLGTLILVWSSTDIDETVYYSRGMKMLILEEENPETQNIIGFKDLGTIGQNPTINSMISNNQAYIYVLKTNGSIEVVDLNDNFRTINSFYTGVSDTVIMMKYQDFLYVGTSDQSIRLIIINVSNDSYPVFVRNDIEFPQILKGEVVQNIKIFNDELFIQFSINFYIFNISDPSNPFFKLRIANDVDSRFNGISDFGYINNTYDIMGFIIQNYDLYFFGRKDLENNNFTCLFNIPFPEYLATIKFSTDGKMVFFGTDSGLKIFGSNTFTNEPDVYLISTLFLSADLPVTDIEISEDGRFLSVNSVYINYIIDIAIATNPQILQTTSVPGYFSYSTFFPNNSYIFLHGELATSIVKFITVDQEILTPTLKLMGQQYNPNSGYWTNVSESGNFLYSGDLGNNLLIFDIRDPEGSAINIVPINSTDISENSSSCGVFAFNYLGLQIYNVTNGTYVEKLGQYNSYIDNLYIFDIIVSKDQGFVFTTFIKSDLSSMFSIIDSHDFNNPKLLSQNLQYNSTNITLAINPDETIIFIAAGEDGISIVNISDKLQPSLITTFTEIDVSFKYIAFLIENDTNNTFIVTCNDQNIFIYQYLSINSSFIYISTIGLNDYIYELKTLDENYVVAMGGNFLYLINVHIKSSPLLINSLAPRQQYTQLKMSFSINKDYIFLPSIEVVSLFDQPIDIYLDLTFSTVNTKKTYTLTGYPFNLKSQNMTSASIKLLQVYNMDAALFWIAIDLDSMVITLTPNDKNDLYGLQQPVFLKFSIPIKDELLSSIEKSALLQGGIIDDNNFLTNNFDPSIGLSIDNSQISLYRLNFILSLHYFTRNIYFPIDKLIAITPIPRQFLSLQKQFDDTHKLAWITVNQRLDFQFSSTTFQDLDGTSLTYTTSILPPWLLFDSTNLQFTGTPALEDRMNYSILVIASNGFQEINDSFNFTVDYQKPYINPNNNMQSQLKDSVLIGNDLSITFKPDTFIDPNNDSLTYVASYQGGLLESWMTFDSRNINLQLQPTQNQFLDVYTIDFNASNTYFWTTDSITFRVYPSWEFILQWLATILGPLFSLIGLYKYRAYIFHIFCKRYYFYKDAYKACLDTYFEKEIYFINQDVLMARKLWESLNKSKKTKKLIDFDDKKLLEEELVQTYEEIKLNLIDLNIEIESLKINGTIFEIIQCFITVEILRKHPFSKIIYEKLKDSLQKTIGNTWYFELCSLDSRSSSRNRKAQKFPNLLLKKEEINEKIQLIRNEMELKNQFKKMPRDDSQFVNKMVERLLKMDVFGIPPYKKKFTSFIVISNGESMFIETSDIQEINSEKRQEGSSGFLGPRYTLIEAHSNKKLPRWLDYKIEQGVLKFFGTPGESDICEYRIKILNRIGMNLRNFGVIVSDRKQENSSSNYVEVDNVKAEVIPMFEENIKLNMGLSPGRSCLTESSDFRKKKEKIIKFEMINTPTMPLKGGVDK